MVRYHSVAFIFSYNAGEETWQDFVAYGVLGWFSKKRFKNKKVFLI